MSHLDETRVKDKDVWWVPRDVLRSALPLDGTLGATRVAMTVHIQSELCEQTVSRQMAKVSDDAVTIVAEKELILAGAEHAHRTT
jgi:hypothetical protein